MKYQQANKASQQKTSAVQQRENFNDNNENEEITKSCYA